MDVLLASNSTNPGDVFFAHLRDEVTTMCAGRRTVFVPYALAAWDEYAEKVRLALGVPIVSAHECESPAAAVVHAECLIVGGGNTFRLLAALERLGVLATVGAKVRRGDMAYVGASAGTNVAGAGIWTTNDMPIAETAGLRGMQIVPFSMNPHYTDAVLVDARTGVALAAETRDERIGQCLEERDVAVLALWEGAWLRVRGEEWRVHGQAKVFERSGVQDVSGADVAGLASRRVHG